MQAYEALVIVDALLEEGDIQKAVDRFLGAVSDSGGKVTGVERWGTRRFAYEIAHQREGYYFITNFQAAEDVPQKLERTIQISEEFVRCKIVRPE